MEIVISHARASGYKIQYDEILAKIRKGKSKVKNLSPDKLEWKFSWGVSIELKTFAQIIADHGKSDKELTEDEHIADFKKRCMVHLRVSQGRGWWYADTAITEIPEEIVEIARGHFRKDLAEKHRYESMSEGDRRKEIAEALTTLAEDGSFTVFNRTFVKE